MFPAIRPSVRSFRRFNPPATAGGTDLRRFVSRHPALLIALVLTAALLAINFGSVTALRKTARAANGDDAGKSPRAIRSGPVFAPADAPTNQPTSNLQGQPAVDYLKDHGIYDRLSASIEKAQYEIDRAPQTNRSRTLNQLGRSDRAEVYTATNLAQNLGARFSDGQVLLEPLKTDCRGELQAGLRLRSVGYGERQREVTAGRLTAQGDRVEYTRSFADHHSQSAIRNPQSEITEWYVNDQQGIEQGFTLAAPPGKQMAGAPLRLRMSVTGRVRLAPVDGGQAVELKSESGKVWLRYDHLTVTDAQGTELPAKVEARGREISLVIDDAKAVYPVQIDPLFSQTTKLNPLDVVSSDRFGSSVSISGDTVVVGASNKNFRGVAYIFGRNTGGADNWGLIKKVTAGDAASGDFFGNSVSIDGDTVVVGANGKDSQSGAAYIFGRNTGGADNWGQVQKLTAGDAAGGDQFGISVSIDGDTVVVGANGKNANTGAAYIFGRNTGGADTWGQIKKLTAGDAAASDQFGVSVSINGDTVVVGAYAKNSQAGAAYIFGRNTGGADNWGQVQKLTAGDAAAGDQFGSSVSISGDTVVVGASTKNFRGVAYIFGRNTGGADNWGQVKELTAGDAATGDQFGTSVSISGDTVVVGAYAKTSATGAAYLFVRNQGGANNWGQVQKLIAGDAATNDGFGSSVSISGGTVVVGASLKSSFAGAGYVFQNQCGSWSQSKEPVAGDAATSDQFGYSVSISGDTAVVGANGKNANTGAAYIFGRNSGGADNWGQVKKLTAGDAAAGDQFGVSVSINGDTVVVGAPGKNSSTGAAYIFGRNTGGVDNWGQVQKLTAGDAATGDNFGYSVSIDGDTVVVGAAVKNSLTGAAYIFGRNTGGADNWGQVKKLTAGDAATFDFFGFSVSINGDTVVVGAYGKTSSTGAAYIFGRNQGGTPDNWGQVQKLTAGDGATGDNFGASVSIDGDTVVVGAYGKTSSTGAAYVFGRNTGGADIWGQVKKLTAGDAATGDNFGASVSIDGDTVVVGAYGKTSSTGAAYIFGRNSGGADIWGQVKKLTAGDAATGDAFGVSVSISGDTVVVGANGKNSNAGAAYIFDLICPLTISKSFGASSVTVNGTTTLTFTITNPNTTGTQNAIGFTDNLPSGLVVADTPNASNTCGGTFNPSAGNTTLTFSGGTLSGGQSCTVSVSVKPTTLGIKNNSVQTSSTEGGTSGTSNASFTSCPASLIFTVNSNLDTDDANQGDGVCDDGAGHCTLRAAIEEANALSACTFDINLSGVTSPLNLGTALPNINGNVNINGPGANLLTVQRSTAGGTPDFRVFTISSGATVKISGLTISNGHLSGSNSASGGGGGIGNDGTLTVASCAISGNTAGPGGGGISNGLNNPGTLTVTNSTISGNTASAGGGGGIRNPGTLTVTNSTISGNSANKNGGGILNDSPNKPGTANITNTTITNNRANKSNGSSAGGGVYSNSNDGTVTLRNTIVAGNFNGASGTTADDVNGSNDIQVDTNSFNNLIGDGTGLTSITDGSNGNHVGSSGSPIDPKLDVLGNYGGPTQTHQLKVSSPAINNGTDVTTLSGNGGSISDSATSIIVADASSIPAGVGFLIRIENEQMSVTSKSTNTLTVVRAANSTTAAAHNDGTAVNPAFDQRGSGFPRNVASAVDIGAFENQCTTPATPTINPSGSVSFCVSGTLTSSSSTGNQWYKDSNLLSGETNQTLNVTASGSYTVTVTDSGCTSSPSTATTVTVNPNPPTPTITPGGPTTFCQGNSVTLTSSSASGNQWKLNGNPIGGATANTYNANASGTYTVTVTDGNGCSATSAQTTVTVNPNPPTPTITPGGPTTFCQGGSVTLTSSSASGNQWKLNGSSIGGATANTYNATASGSYTVTVTDGNGCSATSTATVVTVNPNPPTPTITPGGPTTFCQGGSVTLTSSSASGNQWKLNGNPIGGQTNQTYIASASGSYTVTVTDGNGCTSAASSPIVVTVNPLPATPTITPSGSTTFCDSGTLTSSSASGNKWYKNTVLISGATNQTYNATSSGSYTVTVTDGNGCTSNPSAATTVTVNNSAPVVTTNADSGAGSLRQAIIDACDGATITFDMSQVVSPITLTTGQLIISKNLTIQGPTSTGLTISGNNASRIFNVAVSKNFAISSLTIDSGRDLFGGGILNAGNVTITNSTISNNQTLNGADATGSANGGNSLDGGGIYSAGTLTIVNSTISGNKTGRGGDASGTGNGGNSGNGGGIYFAGTLRLTNTTIANNQTGRRGGPINPNTTGAVGVVGNGGGIFQSGGTLILNNTIVAGNTDGLSNPDDINGSVDASSSFNLIGTDSGLSGINNGSQGNQIGSSPPLSAKLNPLADNGGPTFTHLPQNGSPVIDAGSNALAKDQNNNALTTDQRGPGFDRILNGTVEIGSVEVNYGPPGSSADIGVTKSANPDQALADSDVTYTITVSNGGPNAATNATLIDNLPAAVTFVSLSSPGGWSCNSLTPGSGGTLTCTNPSLQLTSGAVFTLVVHIKPGTAQSTFVTNKATVSTSADDPNTENNTSTTSTLIIGPSADVGVTKFANADTAPADRDVVYTITVSNGGPNAAANATLNDVLPGSGPSAMTFVSLSSPAGWSCTTPAMGATGTVNCTNSSLAVTSGQVFTLTGHIPPGTSNGTFYNNQATVTSSTSDPNPDNNSYPAGTTVVSCVTDPVVTTNADSGAGSLRQAIIDACDGSTINFDMTQVTSPITLTTAELLINKNLTINGPGANLLTVMRSTANATPNFSVFTINGGKTVSISGLTISNGNASIGGGIYNQGTLTLTGSTISGNSVNGTNSLGGGIASGTTTGTTTLTITNSTISGNSTNGTNSIGGGIVNSTGSGTATLIITNSTISGNSATGGSNFGGGIYNSTTSGTATVTITNSTISGNSANGSGGGIFKAGGGGTATSKLSNTIVAGNTKSNGTTPDDINGTVDATSSFNLIGTGGSGGLTNGVNSNQVGVANARLGLLAFNGGPTQTMALLGGSPAIDQGAAANDPSTGQPITTDQRGQPRPVNNPNVIDAAGGNASDIGAYEAAAPPVVSTPTVAPTNASEGSSTSFTVSGTFTDGAATLEQPFTAVVNWGDTTTSTATVSGGGNPFSYSFTGNHTYAQSGAFNVTVSVTDTHGGTGTSAARVVTVANVAPTVGTPTVSPTNTSEGSSTAFSVSGTFTDPAGAFDAPFTAVVNWGDSTSSTATVSGGGNPFSYSFTGNHTYAQSGAFNVTVSVTDTHGGTGTSAARVVTVANVAPTVNTPVVSPTNTSEGSSTAFSVSGTFTDPAGALDQPFTAVVNWGDSTTSTATVSGSGNPFSYSFSGNHTYAQSGSFNVTVSVTDKDGGTGTSAARVVTVANVAPTVSTPVVSPTNAMAGVGAAFSVSGTFTDPAGALDQPFTAVVNWGDSTTSTATVSGGGNPFNYSFSGNHTYAAVGSFNVTVSVTDKDGGTGTSSSTAVTVAAPTPVYADATGGNCGGKTPCFTSIQAAINAVASGGVVNVIGGVFNESVNLNKSATVNIQGNTTINDFTISAGTLNGSSGGSFTLTLAIGDWNNNGGTFNPGTGTVSFTGNGQTIGGANPTTFNNLTLGANGTILNGAQGIEGTNNVTPAAAPVDTTVGGLLTLNGDLTTTGAAKVIMLATATSTGPGDVVGNVQRLGFVSGGAALSLGNALNTIQINSGTAPTDITINLVKAAPAGFSGAVKRTYTITPNPANGITFSASLQLRYLTSELNGNTEGPTLRFWKFVTGKGWQQQDFPLGLNTTDDLINHALKLSNVGGFSAWTMAAVRPTAASSTVSGRIVDNNGQPVEGAVIRMNGTQTRKTITDALGNYQFDEVETNGFYTVTPSRANYSFSPPNRSFSQLGNQTDAAFDASFSGDKANPLDTAEYFVRQQYVDILGREPDEGGFNYWSDQILACNGDAACIQSRRVAVAAAFFVEQEFQQTGSFIYDVYSGALGRRPAFAEYAFDRQQVIGGATLDAEKTAFTQNFVQRPEFVQKYSNAMTAESFVDALLQTVQQSSGVDLGSNRAALIARYQSGADMNQSRSFVLSDMAANAAFNQAQYNSAFVLTEYFGYLRRDPDQGGYDFWLNVVNDRSPNNYQGMVCAFVTSAEYQRRFGSIVAHTNSECGP